MGAADGNVTEAEPKTDMGGLFSMKNLPPGVYEVLVHGVVVKAGVRTMLNVVVNEGAQLQEIGRPVATEQALIVARELERPRKQVDSVQNKSRG